MPGGNRTGPLGQGPKTGRFLEYFTGNDALGYTKRNPEGIEYNLGSRSSCRKRIGCRARQSLGCRSAFGFEVSEASCVLNACDGYYPEPSQERAESEAEFFEKRINFLKQELETLYRKLKTRRLQESGGQ